MRKEDELILACARFTPSPNKQFEIESLLQHSLDWQYIVKSVTYHNVAYLVYRSLKNTSAPIDPNVLQFLRSLVLQANNQSLHQTSFLLKLLSLFQKQNITVVPFKGPALSQILYKNPAIRSYGDLDILVHIADAEKASQLLKHQGFTPEISLSESELQVYVQTEDNITFYNAELKIVVELHWEITGRYLRHPLFLDRFQECLQEITISGVVIDSLSDEDLLLYLCIHGTKHMWSRLEWICCVAELLNIYDFDWQKVITLAKEYRCLKMLLLSLALVSDLLDIELPHEIAKFVLKHEQLELVHDVREALFTNEGLITGCEDRFSKFHLKNRDSFLDSFLYGLNLFFQPTYREWQTLPLPHGLTFLYYGFRPMRLGYLLLKRSVW